MTHRFDQDKPRPPYRLTVKAIAKLSAEEAEELYRLTVEGDSAMKRFLHDRPRGSLAVIARSDDEIAGWAMVAWGPSVNKEAPAWVFVAGVFVTPEHRRRGCGQMLLRSAVVEARRIRTDAAVVVGPRDEIGANLFRSCGFVEQQAEGGPRLFWQRSSCPHGRSR
jgi:GNAT superfamily N-acetyltransferase